MQDTAPTYLARARAEWDGQAPTFDQAPDHGLRDPAVRSAWREAMIRWLPSQPGRLLDVGCGTGSMSIVAANLGHTVTGIDASTVMITLARKKAAAENLSLTFELGDAANPAFLPVAFDTVLCRHVLWSLPNPADVLDRWSRLLAPGGRLILIEGFWWTGGGLKAADLLTMLPVRFAQIQHTSLANRPDLWGGVVTDERYVVIVRE